MFKQNVIGKTLSNIAELIETNNDGNTEIEYHYNIVWHGLYIHKITYSKWHHVCNTEIGQTNRKLLLGLKGFNGISSVRY